MTKQSQKSMKAQLINELSKQYKQKYENTINSLQERLTQANNINKELSYQCNRLENTIDELQEKVIKYEDWIRRLQEWCNLPEDERIKAITEYKQKLDEFEFSKEVNNKLHQIFAPYMNAILTTGF